MHTKTCFRCNHSKPLAGFYRHKEMADGHLNKCKECTREDVKSNRRKNISKYREYDSFRQRHSKDRIFQHRYAGMLARVEGRATRAYKVEGKEMLSKNEYREWIRKNIGDFGTVYRRWADSGFVNSMSPSIDRIDNSKGYVGSNMRWVSKSENSKKYTAPIPF